MTLTFGNPAALWALLGIPAVLAIHFLQMPSRRIEVSTLFLLERLDPKSLDGARLERLRSSVPLWLQLLAVLLITWILAKPVWLRPNSAQTVVVMLNSSVSMRAFKKEILDQLPPRLDALSKAAAHTEWLLLETDPDAGRLYSGASLSDLCGAIRRWEPRLGAHDFAPAIRVAQAALAGRGAFIFVTDRPAQLPAGVNLFAIGHPIENVGFCGVHADANGWEALVKNYGSTLQHRRWWIEVAGKKQREESLDIQPGQVATLHGSFAQDRIEIKLDPDEFSLDDTLPLIRPEPKRLRVQVAEPDSFAPWMDAFLRSEPMMEKSSQNPDLQFAWYDPLAPALPVGPAVVCLKDTAPSHKPLQGMIVAASDPLTAGLSWGGLLASDAVGFPRKPGDTVLLWQGDRPMLLCRGQQLLVNFDVRESNAARLPAFILLLHRFAESVRQNLIAPERSNVETNQLLEVASKSGELVLKTDGKPSQTGEFLRAPAEPAFFEVQEHGEMRLAGAAHFADTREADFNDARSVDGISNLARTEKLRNSRADAFTPVWVLLLAVVLGANWNWRTR